MDRFLAATEIIDWRHPAVEAIARARRGGLGDKVEVARRCFEWVRDQIRHSVDFRLNPVTLSASQTLLNGTGFCFAKSHLLAALLRANGIPAGLCYQRLSLDDKGPPFSLHGLNAVYLEPWGWYRADPRGNRPGVDTRFTPPEERLAYRVTLPGEADLPGIYSEPLPEVVAALRRNRSWEGLWRDLPDLACTLPERAETVPEPVPGKDGHGKETT